MEQIRIDTDDYHQEEEEEVPMIVEDQDSGSVRPESNPSDTDSDSGEQNNEDSESDCESETAESNSTGAFTAFTGNGMMFRVNDVSEEYESIVRSFAVGMGSAAGVTEVVAVHKKSISGLTGRARFETFRVFSQAVGKKCGGNANIRYAWYSGSRDEIAEIMDHGFNSRNADECGRIQLIPVKFALDGALGLEVGDDGLRHMLLCRVILGKMEVVPSGSGQVVPGSNEFDSGVDSVVNPRKYFVWSAFMNSHILPAYVVSFKGPASLKGYVKTTTTTQAASIASAITQGSARYKRAVPGRVTLAALVTGLTRFLTPQEMKIIVRLLDEFKAKKITGEELKRKARLVAGDKLISALKLMSSNVKGSGTVGGLQLENGSVRDIYLPGLITVLAGLLPAPKTALLSKSLGDFRAKKITRRQLARCVRIIVGNDSVLVSAINSYRISKQQQQDKSPV
ncbi:putative inactive poly [ADP-ribose] polymerase SRO2 [Rosa sericea]